MKQLKYIICYLLLFFVTILNAQVLMVKQGKNAFVKSKPNGNALHIDTLLQGTQVLKLGEFPRYYSIQLSDGKTGYSYKGNFIKVTNNLNPILTKESLWAKTNVLKIIVLDVEVGDATLIICPYENGRQDIILIDTGEKNDDKRIKQELIDNGITLSGQPITRFYNSHYDADHMGAIKGLSHLIEMVYDTGDNHDTPTDYKKALTKVDRRTISLEYQETFSGGVTIECVAVNNSTDFDPTNVLSEDKNTNSIALIISYNGFDYFTAGDLTFKPEKSLAKGIKNCDVYHVNHHGSRTTSSDLNFIKKLDPEVSVVSNGHRHGHPSGSVGKKLVDYGSKFYQTNINKDTRAYHPHNKYIGDITYFSNKKNEDKEGATGSIRLVVGENNYYVLMSRLPLDEAKFKIE